MKFLPLLFLCFCFFGCDESEINNLKETDYFPPIGTGTWETDSPENMGWDVEEEAALYQYLSQNETRAFLVLVDGKIVIEQYWGDNITKTAPFDKESLWYWASAGKTLTALLVGIAQEKGLLDINKATSHYLGENWSSLPLEKEELILLKHQLTMSTGLDYTVSDINCTEPDCLQYKADAGMQWYYHNAPYTLLEQVVSKASGVDYNLFTDANIEVNIGMEGFWRATGYNNIYWSTPRDAARFGLLLLNKGKWGETTILGDSEYFEAMVNPSQDMNPSYGYLTWLNGQSSIKMPGSDVSWQLSLSENAPADLFTALGKNGQFIDVIPSKNMVVIRMGEAPESGLVSITLHDEMWGLINQMIL